METSSLLLSSTTPKSGLVFHSMSSFGSQSSFFFVREKSHRAASTLPPTLLSVYGSEQQQGIRNSSRRVPIKVPPRAIVKLKEEQQQQQTISVGSLYQNGDPLGSKHLGKCVVRWICRGMRAMAADFASAEVQGEFSEVRQRMGTTGLTFVIQAQPYLNAVPMPKGWEAICLKVCTHYPTLFDHFQRELRDVLLELQHKSLIQDWRKTQSWMLLKDFASSGPSVLSLHTNAFMQFFLTPNDNDIGN